MGWILQNSLRHQSEFQEVDWILNIVKKKVIFIHTAAETHKKKNLRIYPWRGVKANPPVTMLYGKQLSGTKHFYCAKKLFVLGI